MLFPRKSKFCPKMGSSDKLIISREERACEENNPSLVRLGIGVRVPVRVGYFGIEI